LGFGIGAAKGKGFGSSSGVNRESGSGRLVWAESGTGLMGSSGQDGTACFKYESEICDYGVVGGATRAAFERAFGVGDG